MSKNIERKVLSISIFTVIIVLIVAGSPLNSLSNINPQATPITIISPIKPTISPITPITIISPTLITPIIPSFTLEVEPASITIMQGEGGSVKAIVSSLLGFSSSVSLSSSSPGGVTVSISPSSVTPPSNGKVSATVSISVGKSVGGGTYSIVISGISGTLKRNATLTLIVKTASTTPTTATPTKTTVPLPPKGFDILSLLPYIVLAIIVIVVILLATILLRRRKPSPPPVTPPSTVPKPPEPAEPTRRYCMHCGSVMPKDALFCPRCGKQPPGGPDTKTCPNCGSVINLIASYCPKCGAAQPKG